MNANRQQLFGMFLFYMVVEDFYFILVHCIALLGVCLNELMLVENNSMKILHSCISLFPQNMFGTIWICWIEVVLCAANTLEEVKVFCVQNTLMHETSNLQVLANITWVADLQCSY